MITIYQQGNFNKTESFLTRVQHIQYRRILNKYGQEGVRALAAATPKDTGETAASWDYKVHISKGTYSISWTNSNVVNGVPIAVLLQFGHGTRHGGYVQGTDYINPALKPIFEKIANEVWKEVTK